MADFAAKIGQAISEKVASEVQKGSGVVSGSQFEQLLTSRMEQLGQQTDLTQKIMQSYGLAPAEQQPQLKAISGEGLEIRTASITENQEIRTQGKALELLTEVNRGALQMDNIIEMTTSGRSFSPPELLALQAGVHQIALNIDLTGKILEQVNTGTKTLLQTNFA